MNSKLVYKVVLPKNSKAEKHPTILFLHGRGADENDLLGLSEYFDESFPKGMASPLYISVRAPFRFEYGGFTWYDILEAGKPDDKMFPESCNALSDFFDEMSKGLLAEIKEFPIDEKKIFLLGFSMGTVMAYSLALTRPNEIAGVIANSGYIAEGTHLNYEWEKISNDNSPSFFVTHGLYDPVLPVSFGRRAKQLLEQYNAKLEYKEYPMEHQISEESLGDVANWLKKQMLFREA
ncbi:MAG: dienelactone hydrolase family protein [Ignavibacteriales bacterium]|nr:dienelactone hydrolase family protein [Ignavibacteriales bacterium]